MLCGKLNPVFVNPLEEKQAFIQHCKALTPIPWATYSLISVNILIWLAMLTQDAQFLLTQTSLLLKWAGNLLAFLEVQGKWWNLLTATFWHANVLQLVLNMLGLYTFGTSAERLYGRKQLLLIYFCSALLASCASLYVSELKAISTGPPERYLV